MRLNMRKAAEALKAWRLARLRLLSPAEHVRVLSATFSGPLG